MISVKLIVQDFPDEDSAKRHLANCGFRTAIERKEHKHINIRKDPVKYPPYSGIQEITREVKETRSVSNEVISIRLYRVIELNSPKWEDHLMFNRGAVTREIATASVLVKDY